MTRYCVQMIRGQFRVMPESYSDACLERTSFERAARVSDYLNVRMMRSVARRAA